MDGWRRRDGRTRWSESCGEQVRHRHPFWVEQGKRDDKHSNGALRGERKHCRPAVATAEQSGGFDE
jgi:hypothetical protein